MTVVIATPAYAQADARSFDVPAADAASGISAFAAQADVQIITNPQIVRGRRTNAVRGRLPVDQALRLLLQGSGLTALTPSGGATSIVIRPIAATTPSPPVDAPPTSSNDIIVTAQKREQRIQDVPIAISAFSGKTLDAMKIETGADLLKSIPNVTFSKNNFAGYNFSIRGIGTKAVAASTDPAVAVAFNSSNLIINRLFEQEFFDIERVEVLRGPQGTLYGRNATAGVVNIISNKANLAKSEGFIKLETGSFKTRRASGAINAPIIEDRLAIRVAGAYTKRDGFAINDYYDKRVDGRDLFSTRVTVSARPIDPLRVDLIWEHFNENDNRSRTGKQLCHKDDGPSEIGGNVLQYADPTAPNYQPQFSQGCKEGSLYDDSAYSTPNGRSLNAFEALASLANNTVLRDSNGDIVDPYAGVDQSRNLRRYSAVINPRYKTSDNVLEANATLDLGPVDLISQTVYDRDRYYSTQDYSRYASNPIFANVPVDANAPNLQTSPDGVFDDRQLGPSNLFLAGDLVDTRSHQFSQEIRLQSSDPSSKLQYVIGGNYTDFRYDASYNVYINTLSYLGQSRGSISLVQTGGCEANGNVTGPNEYLPGCVYTDGNPIGKGPQDGHNYFRSINPYHLTSWGAFADATYSLSGRLKLIAGARLNIDRKRFDQVPSQLLLGTSTLPFTFGGDFKPTLAGFVDRGYPTVGTIRQSWTKPTGRVGFQWNPDIGFTDKTMAYATYSRGYKAGGANPPGPGFGTAEGGYGASDFAVGQTLNPIFKPEYINSYEVGVKNTLLGGRLTFDATGFFYDYTGYQVSQIIDRSSQNENFDATVWGLEFETVFNPFRNLAINANLGYERSRIKNGQQSIDVLDRTQGRDGYYVVKPFVQLPSNCVVNQAVIDEAIKRGSSNAGFGYDICQGSGFSDTQLANLANYAPGTTLDQLFPNGGKGFYADLSHNELPNTPHLTFNIGAQYTLPVAKDWGLIGRVDFYHQSSSYARVYNDIGDRLHGWQNLNLSLRLGNERLKLLAEFYVKNVLDSTPITDVFINSDDTGLTTNVFTLDPRIFGVNITKGF